MRTLLPQLKKRRLALGLKQKDMMLSIGVSRQQYQQLESKGNPRLSTLTLVAHGLKSELMLIPQEKLDLIQQIADDDALYNVVQKFVEKTTKKAFTEAAPLNDNPWQDFFEGIEGVSDNE